MACLVLACEQGRSILLDPQRTALGCIDFQADFVLATGMSASRGMAVAHLAAALPAAARALQAARAAGMLVFHTREAYAPDLSDLSRSRRRNDTIVGAQGPLGRFLIRGEAGSEIVAPMRPIEGEPVLDKAGFNAFHRTALDTVLRAREIETVLLMGFTTQCCVSSTLRGAVEYGYQCVLLQDASAAYDPLDHQASVRVIYSEHHNFGWVSDSLRLQAAVATAVAGDVG